MTLTEKRRKKTAKNFRLWLKANPKASRKRRIKAFDIIADNDWDFRTRSRVQKATRAKEIVIPVLEEKPKKPKKTTKKKKVVKRF